MPKLKECTKAEGEKTKLKNLRLLLNKFMRYIKYGLINLSIMVILTIFQPIKVKNKLIGPSEIFVCSLTFKFLGILS